MRIRLLGSPEVGGGAAATTQPAPAVLGLLAYLVINRDRQQHRTVISTALWPDTPEPQGRRRLNTALWRLRKFLDALTNHGSGDVIRIDGEDLAYNEAGPCWSDITFFQDAVTALRSRGRPDTAIASTLETAVDVYRGDLLEGRCDEWLLREREQLSQAYLSVLEALAEWNHGLGNTDQAIRYGELILARDPLRESVHRALMTMHAERGDRSAALRQFASCERELREHLGINPMPETMLMAARIRHPAAIHADLTRVSVPDAVSELRTARDHAKALHDSLSRAIEALEQS